MDALVNAFIAIGLLLILVLETGMIGSFLAEDLILFFVFFEIVLLPMYFMIGVWGGEQRQYASLKFFLFTMFGSAFMLLGFLGLFFKTGGTTFGIQELAQAVQQQQRFALPGRHIMHADAVDPCPAVADWRTGMIAVSERVREDVMRTLRLGPERVCVIYNGIDLAR